MDEGSPKLPEFRAAVDKVSPAKLHDEVIGILLQALEKISKLLESTKAESQEGEPQVPLCVRISVSTSSPELAQEQAIRDAYEAGVLNGEAEADEGWESGQSLNHNNG